MKVIDLIIKLQQLNPNRTVMFDATKENADMFKLVSIDEAEEIETSEGEQYVLLTCLADEPPRQSMN